jgi:hypothetical protein
MFFSFKRIVMVFHPEKPITAGREHGMQRTLWSDYPRGRNSQGKTAQTFNSIKFHYQKAPY